MDNALNTSNPTGLKSIIKNLKILGYTLENWDSEFVKTILTTPCSSRKDILCWMLKLFGFQYSVYEIRTFDNSVMTKILSDLLSIGICKSQDISLINGTANLKSQLKFWRTLIDIGLRTRNSIKFSHRSDSFLYDLVTSPYYEASLKDENLNLIPEDLKPLYKNFSEKIVLKEKIQDLKEEYSQEEGKPEAKALSNRTLEDEVESAENLLKTITSLRKQNEVFLDTYETNLKPWCKISPSASLETPSEMGELASKCYGEMKQFLKFVSLVKDVDSNSEKITEHVNKLESQRKQNNATKLLQSITE